MDPLIQTACIISLSVVGLMLLFGAMIKILGGRREELPMTREQMIAESHRRGERGARFSRSIREQGRRNFPFGEAPSPMEWEREKRKFRDLPLYGELDQYYKNPMTDEMRNELQTKWNGMIHGLQDRLDDEELSEGRRLAPFNKWLDEQNRKG